MNVVGRLLSNIFTPSKANDRQDGSMTTARRSVHFTADPPRVRLFSAASASMLHFHVARMPQQQILDEQKNLVALHPSIPLPSKDNHGYVLGDADKIVGSVADLATFLACSERTAAVVCATAVLPVAYLLPPYVSHAESPPAEDLSPPPPVAKGASDVLTAEPSGEPSPAPAPISSRKRPRSVSDSPEDTILSWSSPSVPGAVFSAGSQSALASFPSAEPLFLLPSFQLFRVLDTPHSDSLPIKQRIFSVYRATRDILARRGGYRGRHGDPQGKEYAVPANMHCFSQEMSVMHLCSVRRGCRGRRRADQRARTQDDRVPIYSDLGAPELRVRFDELNELSDNALDQKSVQSLCIQDVVDAEAPVSPHVTIFLLVPDADRPDRAAGARKRRHRSRHETSQRAFNAGMSMKDALRVCSLVCAGCEFVVVQFKRVSDSRKLDTDTVCVYKCLVVLLPCRAVVADVFVCLTHVSLRMEGLQKVLCYSSDGTAAPAFPGAEEEGEAISGRRISFSSDTGSPLSDLS